MDDDVSLDVVVHVMFRTPKNIEKYGTLSYPCIVILTCQPLNKCISICKIIAASGFKVRGPVSALPRFVWSDRSIRFSLFFGGAPENVQTLTQNGTSKPFG